jgi:DNA polymerase-3 subunit alpha
MSKFIHLHTHSHYSLLNALPKVDELIKTAKNDGMNAIAITDSGNMYATIEFIQECTKKEIKPIIGVDFYIAARTRLDKEHRVDNKHTRIVLLAKNMDGYKNLVKLVTRSNLEGFYYKPRIDRELIEELNEGLIAILPSFNNEIVNALNHNNLEKAEEALSFFKKIYKSDLYIEITHHPEISGHEAGMRKLIEFARTQNVPIVAASDVYYLKKEDKLARDTVIAIQKNTSLRDTGEDEDADFSFLTQDEAVKLFKNEPDALENSVKIAEMCNVNLELGKWVFPNMILPEGRNADDELRRVVYEGFAKRQIEQAPEVVERVEYELGVIRTKGYSPYFLVVADLLLYARTHGILSNIRGSVSGSMVTFLAGITNINPLEYEIPFERFLNPDRPSAPDIDMDFADNRRDEMVEYARQKYGHDKVAQIGTFGTMAARGSVKDVARAMGFPYSKGDQISKLIPIGSQGFPMTIEKALEIEPDLKKLYDTDPETQTIIDMAKKIEGNARHISVHAAGVVISPTELTDFTPLQYDTKGENKIISQYDMYSIEEAGLLKFDFLGLKNLSIIADTLKLIERFHNIKIDLDTMDIADKKTYEMLARGETADLFQLNGGGMTKHLMDLKPSSIHDINAMVALYRPGPLQFIPDYIARKHNPKLIKYPDPALEPILRKTYGILVYQDDLLMMANKLAGYSWGEVDKFRKAVGKKIPEEMEKQKAKFIEGCIKHSGWAESKAKEIWAWIEPFAAYGFNKAHSVSYGRVAYQTAYFKANFPGEYMTSILTHEAGDLEKVSESVAECKRLGIPVLPPDINECFQDFTLTKVPALSSSGTPGVSSEEFPSARTEHGGASRDQEIFQQKNILDASENPAPSVIPDLVRNPVRENQNSNSDARLDSGLRRNDNAEPATNNVIRFGLTSIKNFGEGIGQAIIDERKAGGKFISLEDFLTRVRDRNLNKKSLEALIKTGAMDDLGERGAMLGNLEEILEFNKQVAKAPEHQDSLFGAGSIELPPLRLLPMKEASKDECLLWEKELLGLYISGHPLEKYREILEKKGTTIKQTKKIAKEEMVVVVSGFIDEVKEILTKKGDKMCFMKLSDFDSSIEVVFFPKTLEQFKALVIPETCVSIKGKMSKRNDTESIIADAIKPLI